MNHSVQYSFSGSENGWASYPAQVWQQSRMQPVQNRFWHYCADRYGGPILDLSSGNGRYSIALAERGFEVVGVDINEGMVRIASDWARARAAAGERLNVRFQVGDMVRLNLGMRFRLAILPGWGFQLLLSQEDQLAFLERLRRHLHPDGAFAFNTFCPLCRQPGLQFGDGKWFWPPDPAYHNGAIRTYDSPTQVESLVESNVHPIRLRHTWLSEIQLLFRMTGFRIRQLYGDDRTMQPFTGSDGDDYTVLAEPCGETASTG